MTVGTVFLVTIPDPVSLSGEQELQTVLLCEVVALDISPLPAMLAAGQNGMSELDGTFGVILVGHDRVADARVTVGCVFVVVLKNYDSRSLR